YILPEVATRLRLANRVAFATVSQKAISADLIANRDSASSANRLPSPGEDIVPAHKASPIELSSRHERELNELVRAHSTPQKLAARARIILMAAAGHGVEETARRLGIWRKTASQWRRRWQDAAAPASTAARLSDAPRSGAPATFTPEEICQIVALACKNPETIGVPISHWSQSKLARQAVERGIVKSISHSSVGRFFKRSRS
ncbi:MAG: helix-turn-helix domain-containing protein, partial [Acetobacteraceae bacterium]|nr:helix-turn-helix domain-containing protein [Acetobacteraceae bacterium]